ncbi:xanthine dehydrogenase family protein subunit M [Methylibium sp.]|uniref:FAD binding domain-containing protein n=1 Tax=Methylibium sp. TaxID=2067992 RepID=UPI00183BDEB1|nr:xanthine dehydrogenase family protein subunit M [Methylibium sp.]MBA3591826.1 xanthine dehydrogenase family protein subunit M [Methylibium sp.]
MRPFTYQRVDSAAAATQAAMAASSAAPLPATEAPVQFLAGGTTILDLMKLDVMRPQALVDINPLGAAGGGDITAGPGGIRFGALVSMAQAAEHPAVLRDYPVIVETLVLAASAQLRNMASLGGNVLQRTRCAYFRDTHWQACNKRKPGSGCAAMDGMNRQHAVLGTSGDCIATYPGDFAQALIALDATVEIAGAAGTRKLPFAMLHRPPGSTPQIETVLAPGELITAIEVPAGAWTRRSHYLKIRDRESYQFALTSAAVALDLQQGVVREARIALGGVATVPWRAREAEAALAGQRLDETSATAAAAAAFAGAQPREHNAYKVVLGQRTLVRALLEAAEMRV